MKSLIKCPCCGRYLKRDFYISVYYMTECINCKTPIFVREEICLNKEGDEFLDVVVEKLTNKHLEDYDDILTLIETN